MLENQRAPWLDRYKCKFFVDDLFIVKGLKCMGQDCVPYSCPSYKRLWILLLSIHCNGNARSSLLHLCMLGNSRKLVIKPDTLFRSLEPSMCITSCFITKLWDLYWDGYGSVKWIFLQNYEDCVFQNHLTHKGAPRSQHKSRLSKTFWKNSYRT